ncbi:MAG: DEAD/DEAH box helicase [Anaerolineales bacterium]|nr:MAG: DEAD/DEAH box helicase [Anaerolineales bacterium]
MNRAQYLATTHSWLEELGADEAFRRDLAQLRASATQHELLVDQPDVRFTFDEQQIQRYCHYIFSESSLLLREDNADHASALRWMRTPAQAFEFLAKLAAEDAAEFLLLNSALCYDIAGRQANARCLVNLIRAEQPLPVRTEPDPAGTDRILAAAFRRAITDYLARDIHDLQRATADSLSSIRRLQQDVVQSIVAEELPSQEILNLLAHASLHQALARYVQYCLRGDQRHLQAARDGIQKSHTYFQQGREATYSGIVSALRTALGLLTERGTWASIGEHAPDLLDDPVWRLYLANLAYDHSIVEFWPSQLNALRAGILTSPDSYVIQMPTSAGKTLIAELAILAALSTRRPARCLYVAPYRALANEIRAHFAETLGGLGHRVSNLLGGFEYDMYEDFLFAESDILVATPEKIELLLRAQPDRFEDLAVVVVDEGHILDQGIPSPTELDGERLLEKLETERNLGRGALLELLITRLKRKSPDTRFLFLSAVMPDVSAADFSQWLSGSSRDSLVIREDERPSRQVIAKFTWTSPKNGQLEYVSLPKLADGESPFVPYFLSRQRYDTGETTPTGRPQQRSWPDPGTKAQTSAMLAARFARTGPVLVFCASKGHVASVTRHLITSLKYLEASDQLPDESLRHNDNPACESFLQARDWLGDDHPLTQAIRRGVGLHSAALPDPVRQAVEEDFKAGRLRILSSTTTLAQGVNLPIKTAIIHSLEWAWGSAPADRGLISKRDFWNICGRAGRAGRETEGQVVFVVVSPRDEQLFQEYHEQTGFEPVDGALYKLLQALVEKRIDQEELVRSGYLDSHILTLLAEEVVDTEDEAAVTEFLGGSLVGVQAIRNGVGLAPLVSAFQGACRSAAQRVPDERLRQIYASTGLSIPSCEALAQAADAFNQLLTADHLEAEEDEYSFSKELLKASFTACATLPEMLQKSDSEDYRGPSDEYLLLEAWVSGQPIEELRTMLWDPAKAEEFSAYLSDRILYRLPWGFSAFLRVLAFKLGTGFDDLPIAWKHLSSMVKFGVGNVVACWASSAGAPTRSLALQLASHYQPEHQASYPEFLRWLVNLPTQFMLSELEGTDFHKRRLLAVIGDIVTGGDRLALIRSGALELLASVRGIRYDERWRAAAAVKQGDQLTLEPEPDNEYDPYAVQVLFDDQPIGYVEREKARVVTMDIRLGRQVTAHAVSVTAPTDDHPFPRIVMTIKLGPPRS